VQSACHGVANGSITEQATWQ